jgi:hypothetical protein
MDASGTECDCPSATSRGTRYRAMASSCPQRTLMGHLARTLFREKVRTKRRTGDEEPLGMPFNHAIAAGSVFRGCAADIGRSLSAFRSPRRVIFSVLPGLPRSYRQFRSAAYFIIRPAVQLRQAITAQSNTANKASCGFVSRAKPAAVKIAAGNPSVRMLDVVLTVCWTNRSIGLSKIALDNELAD